jgi:hypothetical protein
VNELENCQNSMVFHHSFCVAALSYLTRAGGGSGGAKIRLWAELSQISRSAQNSNLIEKMVSE